MLQIDEPTLLDKITSKEAVVGICGLGYVGLPLALTFGEKGFPVIGSVGSVMDVSVKSPPRWAAVGTSAWTVSASLWSRRPCLRRARSRPRMRLSS